MEFVRYSPQNRTTQLNKKRNAVVFICFKDVYYGVFGKVAAISIFFYTVNKDRSRYS